MLRPNPLPPYFLTSPLWPPLTDTDLVLPASQDMGGYAGRTRAYGHVITKINRMCEWRGELQEGKSPSYLLFQPIFPSSLPFGAISPSFLNLD